MLQLQVVDVVDQLSQSTVPLKVPAPCAPFIT
jgi:hypothetical protein